MKVLKVLHNFNCYKEIHSHFLYLWYLLQSNAEVILKECFIGGLSIALVVVSWVILMHSGNKLTVAQLQSSNYDSLH